MGKNLDPNNYTESLSNILMCIYEKTIFDIPFFLTKSVVLISMYNFVTIFLI